MSVHTEFDQGSLIWVKGELEQTLTRARDVLAAYRETPDAALLKHAQTHLHQVAGALQMVSLDGLARFVEEIEQLITAIANEEVASDVVTLVDAAIADTARYLEDLATGCPNVPLTLLPRFAQMADARKASTSGAELFFPMLAELELPPSLLIKPLGPAEWGSWLREQRRRFEAALLRWIRDRDPAAAAVLGRALADIAAVQPQGLARAFWWTAAAVAETLPSRKPLDIDLKQLLLRLNLQVRRLAEGSSKVAERLFRDMLYVLAHDQSDSALAIQLNDAFALAGLLIGTAPHALPAEVEARRLQARTLREELSAVKEAWTRVATGQRDRLPALQIEIAKLAERSQLLEIDGLPVLWHAIAAGCQRYTDAGVNEGDALEMATALLLVDNALAIFPTRAPDFAMQAQLMSQRLADPSVDTVAAPQLDEVSREAQERLLQAQLAQEMRSNLQQIEEMLDSYFRDSSTQGVLKQLDPGLRQIQGALMMLEKHDAVALLQASQQRIQRYAEQQAAPEVVELEELAEALSSLGFYIDAMAHGRDEGGELLAASLAKLLGTDLVEENVPILTELEQEPELTTPAVPAVQTQVPEPVRALPQSDEAVDAELLEVYLEEAAEVLATIAENVAVARADPNDRESVTVLRRGFHTLKGSGRMVGLHHLGEVAWAIEQALNKWLQAEQPAAAGLLDFVEDTHAAFAGWVEQLAGHGSVRVDEAPWIARAEALRHQFEQLPVEPLPQLDITVAGSETIIPNDDIRIGDVTVSATLFSIFRDEATRHLEVLQLGQAALSAEMTLPANFVLAAHTLGGIASTAGFRSLGELAYGLEHAVQQIDRVPARLANHAHAIDAAVAKLAQILDAIFAQQAPPGPEPELSGFFAINDDEPMELSLDALDVDAIEVPIAAVPQASAADRVDDSQILSESMFAELDDALPADSAQLETVDTAAPWVELDLPTEPIESAVETPSVVLEGLPQLDGNELIAASLGDLNSQLDVESLPVEVESPESLAANPSTVTQTVEPALAEALPVFDDVVVSDDEATITLSEPPIIEAATVVEPERDRFAAAKSQDALIAHDVPSPLSDLLAVAGMTTLAERKAELEASVVDEVDDQLLPVFVDEADELLPQVGKALRALREGADTVAVATLKRTLHTLKGSARMSGAMRIGQATHEMESRLLASASPIPNTALLDELEADYDLILAMHDELTGRKQQKIDARAGSVAGAAQLGSTADAESKTTIRVKSELIDELVNQAGEVAIARSRIEAEMLTVKTSLLDLTENVTRLRGQLRELEIQAESQMQARVKEIGDDHKDFDPLEFDRFTRLQEITRFIAESVNDVATVQHNMLKSLDDSNAALTAQNRMTKELQQSLMRVRMVPFASVSDRLYRLTRQTGKDVGKKVNLELRGGRVEIDRGVLEKMISPFEHMLRNAIDHGLETTEGRAAAGKPEFGEVVIEVCQEGNELAVTLKDDGRGMDLDRIRAKGESLGLILPGSEPTERDLMQLIFEPGFSTASSVTQISGRGIGMDVVKNEISNLGGRVDVSSEIGKGTSFTIHLPLTLAVAQVLLVKAGSQLLAIPSVMIEQVQELKQGALAQLYSDRAQEWMGSRYPFAYFPRLIGDGQSVPEQKRFSTVLLLRSGVARMALHIDQLIKNQEVVVKPIGPQLARIPGVAGATVLGNGDIVLIVNPLTLFERGEIVPTQKKIAAVPEALHTAPLVMVVDDSLTVRKITSRLLAREGFQVALAKDGIDALQQLQDVTPAVMLVDIEMPRMDGFELTRNVRADEVTKTIPIIMITSRTAEKHKNYAHELGVNVFLGKPFQENELLAHIRQFTGAGE